MRSAETLADLAWPLERADDALEALARTSDLATGAGKGGSVVGGPTASTNESVGELAGRIDVGRG